MVSGENMKYYYVSNIYERKFKKLDNARKFAIEVCKSNPYFNKAPASAPVQDDKNRFVGDVAAAHRGFEWRTTIKVFSPHLNTFRWKEKRWVLREDGTIGKRLDNIRY